MLNALTVYRFGNGSLLVVQSRPSRDDPRSQSNESCFDRPLGLAPCSAWNRVGNGVKGETDYQGNAQVPLSVGISCIRKLMSPP
jgi:hypothetical protein